MNSLVDKYLIDGCMRCKFGATPKCKVNTWRAELMLLRQIVLESGLTEQIKWGVPCYTLQNKNILIIASFKDYACISFFKGHLLKDFHKILIKQGDNTTAGRIIKYTNIGQITEHSEIIKSYITEAIYIEKSGQKSEIKNNTMPVVPDELLAEFDKYPEFKKAFYALTAGRQRGYIIYFLQPKQAQSRLNRIEKYKQKILNGEGLNDR